MYCLLVVICINGAINRKINILSSLVKSSLVRCIKISETICESGFVAKKCLSVATGRFFVFNYVYFKSHLFIGGHCCFFEVFIYVYINLLLYKSWNIPNEVTRLIYILSKSADLSLWRDKGQTACPSNLSYSGLNINLLVLKG